MTDLFLVLQLKLIGSAAAAAASTTYGVVRLFGAVDPEAVLFTGSGLGVLAGLFWKVWSDHSANDRERETLNERILALRAERDDYRQLLDAAKEMIEEERRLRFEAELEAAKRHAPSPEQSGG